MRPWFIVLGVVAFLASVPFASIASAAEPDKTELEAHAAFESGRYQRALELFEALYEQRYEPRFLVDQGNCRKRLKQYEAAIATYQAFLNAVPPNDPKRSTVEARIQECRDAQRRHSSASPNGAPTRSAVSVPRAQPLATQETPPVKSSDAVPAQEPSANMVPSAPAPDVQPSRTPRTPPLVVPPVAATRNLSVPPPRTRWWPWALAGALALGAGILAVSLRGPDGPIHGSLGSARVD
jgi:hypothetical protein